MRLKNFSLTLGTQIFKALSDESRVRILFLLYHNNELSISDIEKILEYTQTKTSRHMTYLKNAGLVGSKKVDQWVFYHIKDEVKDLINQIFQFLSKDHVLQEDIETFKILTSNRELAINKINRKTWIT